MTALIALTALGGVASADRGGRHHRDHGGVRVERVQPRSRYNNYRYSRTYVRPSYRSTLRPRVQFVRRPIYVRAPILRYHYYNYYQRPALIVENYPARPGYIWVGGQWTWNGYEWIWQPGHYQPDPNYPPYDDYNYDGSYAPDYNNGGY